MDNTALMEEYGSLCKSNIDSSSVLGWPKLASNNWVYTAKLYTQKKNMSNFLTPFSLFMTLWQQRQKVQKNFSGVKRSHTSSKIVRRRKKVLALTYVRTPRKVFHAICVFHPRGGWTCFIMLLNWKLLMGCDLVMTARHVLRGKNPGDSPK